ncbi:hypothetical protein CGLO_13315 [Colletotrichum gloeosporioides Cg-14]|uniref:Uncharacterized protein n=1 Tax=Colletotrichum gloeosporioides (strain Cg-14) TaxID=1237896 RepID=T0K411_COLGC|nr:hypothetical protein CGLO_13315 [Colletotrichum gloeosporioides Cg-14]
MREIDLNE